MKTRRGFLNVVPPCKTGVLSTAFGGLEVEVVVWLETASRSSVLVVVVADVAAALRCALRARWVALSASLLST